MKTKDKTNKKKKKTGKRTGFRIFIALMAVIFVVSSFFVVKTVMDYKAGQSEYQEIADMALKMDPNLPSIQVNYSLLKEMNPDYVAWLEVPGTNINYPMVYYSDNDYYLRHTFLGESHIAGAIFLDANSSGDFSDPHTIIYGHRMNDGTMFSDIKNYLNADFLAANNKVYIYTKDEKLTYEIFSARQVSIYDNVYTYSFASDNDYAAWLSQMAQSYTGPLNLDGTSQTITLSTCVYGQTDDRNIIQAYLVGREPLEEA